MSITMLSLCAWLSSGVDHQSRIAPMCSVDPAAIGSSSSKLDGSVLTLPLKNVTSPTEIHPSPL